MISFIVADIILQYFLIMRESANLRPFPKIASPWGFWRMVDFYDKIYGEVHSPWD